MCAPKFSRDLCHTYCMHVHDMYVCRKLKVAYGSLLTSNSGGVDHLTPNSHNPEDIASLTTTCTTIVRLLLVLKNAAFAS